MTEMKILLVDDHPLFLEGLENLLRLRQFNVIGTADNGLDALTKTRQLRPDVILMDVDMPQGDGLEATRLIKAEMPETQIVMLTMSSSEQHLFEAIKSGATGYLPKSLDAEGFYELLDGLSRGEAAIPPDLAAKIIAEFAKPTHIDPVEKPEQSRPDDLTPRQTEVLELVTQGLSNSEIADALVITERTVKYHMHEILDKLHLRNRAQVIAYAVRTGLVTIPASQ